MIRDKRDFMIGFLTCAVGVLLLAAAPGEWSFLHETAQPGFLKNGENAYTITEGSTWDLSQLESITVLLIYCNEIVVSSSATIKSIRLYPELTAAEQSALENSAEHNVTMFSIDDESSISHIQHVENNQIYQWNIASTTDTASSTDALRVAINSDLRAIRSEFETRGQ